eukprot:2915142-Amphidinium_carterae.1
MSLACCSTKQLEYNKLQLSLVTIERELLRSVGKLPVFCICVFVGVYLELRAPPTAAKVALAAPEPEQKPLVKAPGPYSPLEELHPCLPCSF